MTQQPTRQQIPQEWGPSQRIYGGPLHEKVQRLMSHPQAPSWARLVRDLDEPLQSLGLKYHLRTLKRQLNGKITYVPAGLETAFLDWLKKHKNRYGSDWVKDLQKPTQTPIGDQDPLLYVPVQKFHQLSRTYQQGHPGFSRRQLALLLQKRLATKNFSVGMEAIQSAVAGKTQRVRRIYEQEMALLVEELPNETITATQRPTMGYGDASVIPQWVAAILAKHPELSKRKLAGLLQQELQAHDITMSLNSLQVILSGKTQKTRRLVLDLLDSWQTDAALNEILKRYETVLPSRSRRNLEVRVAAAWQDWHQALPQARGEYYQSFLELRRALLKERWLYRQKKQRSTRYRTKGKRPSDDLYLPPESDHSDHSPDSASALNWDRLVS